SIFSDSVKFPPGERANFIVHHVDGAKAAAEILPRYFDVSAPDNMARVEGIYRAILEHQIAPPGFLANMAGHHMIGGQVRGVFGGQTGEAFSSVLPDEVIDKLGRSVHGDNAHKLAEFREALQGKNPTEIIQSIQNKMQNPMEPRFRTVDPETGVATTKFTPAERALLETIGVKEWYLPNPDSPWYGASRAVIDGDGLINYATPDGWAKIAAIRGPGKEPWFQDATVFGSLKTAKDSYDDAFSVMTPEGQDLARAGLGRTQGALDRVRQRMEDWFSSKEAIGLQRNADGTIPFWNADLKYPPRGPAPKFELQLDKLSDVERKQFEFAMKIRERMVEELRK